MMTGLHADGWGKRALLILLPLVYADVVETNIVVTMVEPGYYELAFYIAITDPDYYIPWDIEIPVFFRDDVEIEEVRDNYGRAEYWWEGNRLLVRMNRSVYHGRPNVVRVRYRAEDYIDFGEVTAIYPVLPVGPDVFLKVENVVKTDVERNGDVLYAKDYVYPVVIVKGGEKGVRIERCEYFELNAPEGRWEELCSVLGKVVRTVEREVERPFVESVTVVPWLEGAEHPLCIYENGEITCSFLLFFENMEGVLLHEIVHAVQPWGPLWFVEGTAMVVEGDIREINVCRDELETIWECWTDIRYGGECEYECNGMDASQLGYAYSSQLMGRLMDRDAEFEYLERVKGLDYIDTPFFVVSVRKFAGVDPVPVLEEFEIEVNDAEVEELERVWEEVEEGCKEVGCSLFLEGDPYESLMEKREYIERVRAFREEVNYLLRRLNTLGLPPSCTSELERSLKETEYGEPLEGFYTALRELEALKESVGEFYPLLEDDCRITGEEVREWAWDMMSRALSRLDIVSALRYLLIYLNPPEVGVYGEGSI